MEFLVLLMAFAIAWLIYKQREVGERLASYDLRMADLFNRLAKLESVVQPFQKEELPRADGAVPAVPPEIPAQEQAALPARAEETPAPGHVPPVEAPQAIPALPEPVPVMEAAQAAAPLKKTTSPINWERFLGVNLFAWAGGLLLFLGVGFFIKYAFDHDLISPAMRVAIGFAVGLGALVTGLRLSRERYAATVQTLCGAAILILYADVFASHAYYHFIGSFAAFGLMSLVTATAFLLAVRLEAQVIAVLGLLGGFLTPPLLSTGEDRPVGLFSYVALLDAGLVAVAWHRRWDYLVLLSGLATLIMELGWSAKFFSVDRVETAMTIFAAFNIVYLGAWRLFRSRGRSWGHPTFSVLLQAAFSLLFALFLIEGFYTVSRSHPWLLISFIFLIDLVLLAMAFSDPVLRSIQHLAGGMVFLLLFIWTTGFLTPELIYGALTFFLLFAVLHSVAPIVFERLKPGGPSIRWTYLFPSAAILLMLVPLLSRGMPAAFLWLAIMLLNLIGLGISVATGFLAPFAAMLALTMAAICAWVIKATADEVLGLAGILLPLGFLSLQFFISGIFLMRRIAKAAGRSADSGTQLGSALSGWNSPVLVPILASTLPYLLLAQVGAVLKVTDPSPILGMALLFTILLLGLVRFLPAMSWLSAAPLVGVLLVEYVWHFSSFSPEKALVPLLWYLFFPALLGVFPFLFAARFRDTPAPWLTSTLAAPLHFYLLYRAVHLGFPNPFMGVLPAALAIVFMLALLRLMRMLEEDHPQRLTLLALFAGVSLFFVTLIFPVQLEKQWITIGWALEGLALLWLMQRIPHEGLRLAGAGLLVVSFVRLALNPFVFEYYTRSGTPIFNWYLYSFGIVAACLIVGAGIMPQPKGGERKDFKPLLYSLGGVLAFMLLNIEIADYFSEGERLSFEFGGNFARDMSYSLGWGLFAFVVMMIGIRGRFPGARYAGIGLLTITLLKLFLHDLWLLGGLYRIGSFVGLAALLILVSYLYQRFLGANVDRKSS